MPSMSAELARLWSERDNSVSPLLGTPCGKRNLRPLEVRKVNVRRDCATNDATPSVIVGDVKNAAFVNNVDRRLYVNLCFQKIKRHVHSPSPNALNNRASRRLARTLSKVKPICCVNGEPIFTFRQTAESFRPRLTSVGNATLPTPANDNAPDRDARAA
jgi:hypothetical protein